MEFSAPGKYVTPAGDLNFNSPGDSFHLTRLDGGDGAELRSPLDTRPQRDGLIVHRFFLGGVYPTLEGYFKAATVTQRNTLEDELKGKLYSTKRTDGRLRFTPTGKAERFITARLYERPDIKPRDGIVHSFQFVLVSSGPPFWYDLAETDTTILSGANANLNNTGNAPCFPVFQVNGAGTTFTLTNTTTGLSIVVSGLTLGGGDYAEIITYRQTMYLNGTGANLLGKITMDQSDFFTLEPGVNNIALSGDCASVLVKWNNGWY